jgi:hypothetical protein
MSNKVFLPLTTLILPVGGVSGVTWLGSWASPALLSAWAGVSRPTRDPERLVEQVVVLLCAGALPASLLWLSVSVVVCLTDALRDGAADRRAGGLFRPRLVRALVAGAMGAVIASGSGADAAGEPELPRVLDGLTVPDRPYGGVRTHRVVAGDSLWSVTKELLPRDAAHRAVARGWPRLHQLNRDRIGADPDVIHPGTILRLPTWASAPTRGATR